MRKSPVLIFTAVLLLTILPVNMRLAPSNVTAATQTVTVTGVAANNSSVKIFYNPVPGAKDYRIYDTSDPMTVKYAGLTHLIGDSACPGQYCSHHFVVQTDGVTPLYPYKIAGGGTGGPQALDVPVTQIEWNMVEDGHPHTLVVQAVDKLGPIPPASLYSATNSPLFSSSGMMSGLGMNEGPTPDGNMSINGQGPYTNNPQVIAQSQPFIVQAHSSLLPIPSTSSSTQTFLDTFDNSEAGSLTQVARNDANQYMQYTLNAGTPISSSLTFFAADTMHSYPFIDSGHLMDVLFDGGPPDSGWSLHNSYGGMFYSPDKTATFNNGQMLHMTMEVDGHVDPRRWIDFVLTPSNDPLTLSREDQQFNKSDQGLWLQIKNGMCNLNIFTGPTSALNSTPAGTAGGQYGSRLFGAAGQAPTICDRSPLIPSSFSNNGIGLDNRTRFDAFITQTHLAFFEDGQLVAQAAIPAGSFPISSGPVTAYFSHYTYHTDNDINELRAQSCYPLNAYWYNDVSKGTTPGSAAWGDGTNACGLTAPPGFGFNYSDERHWDNIGFEVLPPSSVPANADFSSLASLIRMPQIVAPSFVSSGGTSSPTATTASPTATKTSIPPTATATGVPPTPTSTPKATATIPASGPLMLADFEKNTDGFTGTSNIQSMHIGVFAPAVAHGSSVLAVKYAIPTAWAEAQLVKAVNLPLTSYSTLSMSVYAKTPTIAQTGVKIRFLVQGSDNNWYSSPYQMPPLGTRTTVRWSMAGVPRAPLKQIYIGIQYTSAAVGSSNLIYLDALQAS